jgi:hypothetical protein
MKSNGGRGGLASRSGRFAPMGGARGTRRREKYSQHSPGIELRSSGCTAHSQSLYRLSYPAINPDDTRSGYLSNEGPSATVHETVRRVQAEL